MAICNSCRGIRLGDNNDGGTISESLDAVRDILMIQPIMGPVMIEHMIRQAKKGGACQNCLSVMQTLKNEIEKNL